MPAAKKRKLASGSSDYGNDHNAASERFRGTRLSRKLIRKLPARFGRRQPKLSLSFMKNMFMPTVDWEMHNPQANILTLTSNTGRQGVYAGNNCGVDMLTRGNLRDIYLKGYVDIVQSPQVTVAAEGTGAVNSFYSPHRNINLASMSEAQMVELAAIEHGMPTMIFSKYKRVFNITNVLTTIAYVELWEWVCVYDNGSNHNPHIMWNDQYVNQGTTSKGNYGLAQLPRNSVGPTSEMTLSSDLAGQRPDKHMKELFDNWRVLRKTKYKLEPGVTINHAVDLKGFQVGYSELYGHQSVGAVFLKNLTVYLGIIQIGEKCFDIDSGINGKAYCNTKLTLDYADYCEVSFKPYARKKFRLVTNTSDSFATAWNSQNYVHHGFSNGNVRVTMPAGSIASGNAALDLEG